eukprot:6288739-Prymnesium_polylepis.1
MGLAGGGCAGAGGGGGGGSRAAQRWDVQPDRHAGALSFGFDQVVTIGRAGLGNDVELESHGGTVSRVHAIVVPLPEQAQLVV